MESNIQKWLQQIPKGNSLITSQRHPKISVITPSFNQGEYIEDTIRSVILQNYPNLEFIIIDGGSTDKTISIIKKYKKYIDYWVSEKDNGQSEAINKGLKVATGDIVCWINSDDILLPDALINVGDCYHQSEAHWIVGTTFFIDNNYQIINQFKPEIVSPKNKKFWYKSCGWLDYLLSGFSGTSFPQPSSFWSRTIINSVYGIDTSLHYAMDHDLTIKLAKQNFRPTIINKDLACLRVHEKRKSTHYGQMLAEEMKLIRKYKSYTKSWEKLILSFYSLRLSKYRIINGIKHKNE